MNLRRKISSVILSLAVACNFAVSANSAVSQNVVAHAYSLTDQQNTNEFYSMDDLAVYLREQFKNRNEEISFVLHNDIPQDKEPIPEILRYALEETGVGTEGDYIYLSILSYSCRYGTNLSGTIISADIYVEYNTTYAQEQVLTQHIEKLMPKLSLEGKSDYQKAKIIYDYIADNVVYSRYDSNLVHSAYSALVDGTAVCQGYSQLLYRLYTDAGIPCRVVVGLGNDEPHGWNIAKIDGVYYLLDVTWESNLKRSQSVYFLKGLKDFDEMSPKNVHIMGAGDMTGSDFHTDYSSEEFLQEYPISDYAYDFKYPTGDINNDGAINSIDASLVMAIYSQLSASSTVSFSKQQITAGDLNNDGATNSIDASLIMAYYSQCSTGGFMELSEFIKKIQQ